jgi:bacterioferritin
MKKLMLVLFSFAALDEVIDHSFNLLNQYDKLEVVAVLEEDLPDSLSKLISQIGFLGEKLTNDVKEIIINEYKNRGTKALESIFQKGEEEGYQVGVEQLSKNSLPQLKERLKGSGVDYLIINYTRDQFIANDVLEYKLDDFLSGVELPYDIYYDGKLAKAKE